MLLHLRADTSDENDASLVRFDALFPLRISNDFHALSHHCFPHHSPEDIPHQHTFMSCKIELRRILRSIGSRAVPTVSSTISVLESRRHIYTAPSNNVSTRHVSTQAITPQEKPPPIRWTRTEPVPVRRVQKPSKSNSNRLVLDLLSSIELQLSERRTKAHVQEESKQTTAEPWEGVESWSEDKTHSSEEIEREDLLSSTRPQLGDWPTEGPVEEDITTGSWRYVKSLPAGMVAEEDSELAFCDSTSELHASSAQTSDLTRYTPNTDEHIPEKPLSSLDPDHDSEGTFDRELSAAPSSALDQHILRTDEQKPLSDFEVNHDPALWVDLGWVVDDTNKNEQNLLEDTISAPPEVEHIAFQSHHQQESDLDAPLESRWLHPSLAPPMPTSVDDIANETTRRARLAHKNLPRVPAQILSEEYKDVMLERAAERRKAASDLDSYLQTRHDFECFPPAREWSIALSMLEAWTPKGKFVHCKRREIHSFPDGVLLEWAVERSDAIHEVMLNTGSFLQVQQLEDHAQPFDTFVLFGTAKQNDAARQYIAEQRLLRVMNKAAIGKTAPSLHTLMLSSKYRKYLDTFSKVGPNDDPKDENLDRLRAPYLTSLRSDQADTTTPDILPSWSTSHDDITLIPVIEAAFKRVVLAPLQLNAAVDFMTAAWSKADLRTIKLHFRTHNPALLIGEALSKLLTTPENVVRTSTNTLAIAWGWLVRTRQVHTLRRILDAHDDLAARKAPEGFRAMSTTAFNRLLHSTARRGNINAFRYMLKCMEVRKIPADAASWELFWSLTQKLFPERTTMLLRKMQKYGLLVNNYLRLKLIPYYATEALNKELAAFEYGSELPSAFIDSFLEDVTKRLAQPRWMTTECARMMSEAFLRRGHWHEAFQVCQKVLHDRWRVRTTMSNTFLEAAVGHGSMDAVMAVDVLHRFSSVMIHREPSATTENTSASKAVPPPSSTLLFKNAKVYEKLLDIAIRGRCWNLVRVIWQHACCSGHVSTPILKQLRASISLNSGTPPSQVLDAEDTEQLWRACWGIFAVGVGHKSVSFLDSDLQLIQDSGQLIGNATDRSYSDLAAYGRVAPVNPLEVDARDAVKLDRELQQQFDDSHAAIGQSLSIEQRREQFAWVLGHLSRNSIIVPVRALSEGTGTYRVER